MVSMMNGKSLVLIAVAGIIACSLFVTSPVVRVQAAGNGWSKPVLLYSTSYKVRYPAITVDQRGGVHVFWQLENHLVTTSDGSQLAGIYYTQLVDGRWTKPSDIVLDPSVTAPTAAVGMTGILRLFWTGIYAQLYTSSAPVRSAKFPASWTAPLPISGANSDGQVISDSHGQLYLVYPGPGGSNVIIQTSKDGGATWSFPVIVSNAAKNSIADFTRVAVGPDGTIHVVWTEFQSPSAWPPTGVYYSHSTDGGKTWSNPIQIAGTGFDQINVAVGPHHTVYVAWNGMAGIQGRYSRWSSDNGKTWSGSAILATPGVGGSEGPPQLAVDSAGTPQLVTTDGERVWYSFWTNGKWSQPEYVPSGDEAGMPPPPTPIDATTRHIEQVAMALGQGNELHVVFWDGRQNDTHTNVWYTSKKLDAPAIAPVAFSAPTATPTPGSTPAGTDNPPVIAQTRTSQGTTVLPVLSLDPGWAMLYGIVPAVLLVGSIIIMHGWLASK